METLSALSETMLLLLYTCLRAMRFLLLFISSALDLEALQYAMHLIIVDTVFKTASDMQRTYKNLSVYASLPTASPKRIVHWAACQCQIFLTCSAEQFAINQKPSWTGFCLSTAVRRSEHPLTIPWRTQEALPGLRRQSVQRTQRLGSGLTCMRCDHSY